MSFDREEQRMKDLIAAGIQPVVCGRCSGGVRYGLGVCSHCKGTGIAAGPPLPLDRRETERTPANINDTTGVQQ